MAKRQKTNQQSKERVNIYTSEQLIEDKGEHTEEEGDDVEVLEVTRFQRRSGRVRVPTNRFSFDNTSGKEEKEGSEATTTDKEEEEEETETAKKPTKKRKKRESKRKREKSVEIISQPAEIIAQPETRTKGSGINNKIEMLLTYSIVHPLIALFRVMFYHNLLVGLGIVSRTTETTENLTEISKSHIVKQFDLSGKLKKRFNYCAFWQYICAIRPSIKEEEKNNDSNTKHDSSIMGLSRSTYFRYYAQLFGALRIRTERHGFLYSDQALESFRYSRTVNYDVCNRLEETSDNIDLGKIDYAQIEEFISQHIQTGKDTKLIYGTDLESSLGCYSLTRSTPPKDPTGFSEILEKFQSTENLTPHEIITSNRGIDETVSEGARYEGLFTMQMLTKINRCSDDFLEWLVSHLKSVLEVRISNNARRSKDNSIYNL